MLRCQGNGAKLRLNRIESLVTTFHLVCFIKCSGYFGFFKLQKMTEGGFSIKRPLQLQLSSILWLLETPVVACQQDSDVR